MSGEVLSDACDGMTITKPRIPYYTSCHLQPLPRTPTSSYARRCKSRSFTPGVGREVLLEVNGCQKCSRHHLRLLHESEHLFCDLSTLNWPRSIHRFSAKLSACITDHHGDKTSSRFESWRQHKLLNPSFPSFLCPPVYQDIQRAILH